MENLLPYTYPPNVNIREFLHGKGIFEEAPLNLGGSPFPRSDGWGIFFPMPSGERYARGYRIYSSAGAV